MRITNDKLMEILERHLGLQIGDSGIYDIQDVGTKKAGRAYLDKDSMSIYMCTADNTDTSVTGNFKLYSIHNSNDYIESSIGVGRGGLKYIQDVGTKYVNNVYIDRNTYRLFRCINTTTSINCDDNFKEHNIENIVARLGSLETWSTVMLETTGGTTSPTLTKAKLHITRCGRICFARIDTYSTSFTRGETMFEIPDGFKPSHGGGCDGGFALIAESVDTNNPERIVGTCRVSIAGGVIAARSNMPAGFLGTMTWIC